MPESAIKEVKVLMRLSSITDSLMAALMVETDDDLVVASSVGMDDEGRERIQFKREEEIYKEIFGERKILFLKSLHINIRDLDDRIPKEYEDFLSGILYIPVETEGLGGYVFLGLKNNGEDISYYMNLIHDVFSKH